MTQATGTGGYSRGDRKSATAEGVQLQPAITCSMLVFLPMLLAGRKATPGRVRIRNPAILSCANYLSSRHGALGADIWFARAQGHFQIFFSTKYCPLFRAKLPFMSRLLYCSGVWAYCVNALLTPVFMVSPVLSSLTRSPLYVSTRFAVTVVVLFADLYAPLAVGCCTLSICVISWMQFVKRMLSLFVRFGSKRGGRKPCLRVQAVPIVTIWVGVFPMRVNFWLALSSSIFYAANLTTLYYFKSFSCASMPRFFASTCDGQLSRSDLCSICACVPQSFAAAVFWRGISCPRLAAGTCRRFGSRASPTSCFGGHTPRHGGAAPPALSAAPRSPSRCGQHASSILAIVLFGWVCLAASRVLH